LEKAAQRLQYFIDHPEVRPDLDITHTLRAKGIVLSRYQPIFSPENVRDITKDEFQSFLQFKNNCHWKSLHRHQRFLTADMNRLREGLFLLVNEEERLLFRLQKLYPKNQRPFIPHLGKAVATPILQVVYPDRYGVWNGTSEGGLKKLNLLPEFHTWEDFAGRYAKVNHVLLALSERLKIDLWHLDVLWWYL
jgi:hypothetical protein